MSVNAQDCSELFISEYIEGPGNNNAIEIYNPTNTQLIYQLIQLIDRKWCKFRPDSWPLSGSIAAGEAIAVGNGQTDSVWVSTYWSLPVDPSILYMHVVYMVAEFIQLLFILMVMML